VTRFFLDRSLGGKKVPASLREAGWDIVTMRERYGNAVAQRLDDVTWITEMSAEGFVLLTADSRIVRNELEAVAILEANAVVFMLPTGNLTGEEMAARFLHHQDAIEREATSSGPAGFAVYANRLSRVFP
jgi:hypothetical protein